VSQLCYAKWVCWPVNADARDNSSTCSNSLRDNARQVNAVAATVTELCQVFYASLAGALQRGAVWGDITPKSVLAAAENDSK